MRPFPEKTDSPSVPVSEALAAPQGSWLRPGCAVWGRPGRRDPQWSVAVSRAPGKGRGNAAPAAAAARYWGL